MKRKIHLKKFSRHRVSLFLMTGDNSSGFLSIQTIPEGRKFSKIVL